MKTLTITEGRGQLGYWLKKATEGEDIGFIVDGKIVALRPVEVYSGDYVLREYGLTEAEAKAAARRIKKNIATERKLGKLKTFTGDISALRD
jgi:hypothetical protein